MSPPPATRLHSVAPARPPRGPSATAVAAPHFDEELGVRTGGAIRAPNARRWSRSLVAEVSARSTALWRVALWATLCSLPVALLAFVIDVGLGVGAAGINLATAAWFALRWKARSDGPRDRRIRAASPWVVMMLPTAVTALLAVTVDPVAAIAAPVPTFLAIIVIALSTAHIKPWLPLVLDLLAAVLRAVLYLWVVIALPTRLAETAMAPA